MVRVFCLMVILFSFEVNADFFGLQSEDGHKDQIPGLVEKIKGLDMEASPSYEENFNQVIKDIENAIEEEKLFCSGEAADSKGRVLPKEQKQLCFRELKKHYLEATDVIFNLKKKYLGVVHNRQMDKLSEVQKKLKSDIEKSF